MVLRSVNLMQLQLDCTVPWNMWLQCNKKNRTVLRFLEWLAWKKVALFPAFTEFSHRSFHSVSVSLFSATSWSLERKNCSILDLPEMKSAICSHLKMQCVGGPKTKGLLFRNPVCIHLIQLMLCRKNERFLSPPYPSPRTHNSHILNILTCCYSNKTSVISVSLCSGSCFVWTCTRLQN